MQLKAKTMDSAKKTIRALASGDSYGIQMNCIKNWHDFALDSRREKKMREMEVKLMSMKISYEGTTKMSLMTLCGGNKDQEVSETERLLRAS